MEVFFGVLNIGGHIFLQYSCIHIHTRTYMCVAFYTITICNISLFTNIRYGNKRDETKQKSKINNKIKD